MVAGVRESLNAIILPQQTAPATPPAGQAIIYTESDSQPHIKNDDGSVFSMVVVSATAPTNPATNQLWVDIS